MSGITGKELLYMAALYRFLANCLICKIFVALNFIIRRNGNAGKIRTVDKLDGV